MHLSSTCNLSSSVAKEQHWDVRDDDIDSLRSTPPVLAQTVAMPEQEVEYHPKDAIGITIHNTLITGGAGLFASTVQNTLTKQNVGAFGVFTRTGGTIAAFGEEQKSFGSLRGRTES